MGADEPQPGYVDEGITAYISEWGPEFRDDDPERSLARAHHLWWGSRLPRWAFHNAMKAARHATASRLAKDQIHGSAMAYFFGVLEGAVGAQCLKAGLPIPRGAARHSDAELDPDGRADPTQLAG